MHHAPTTFSTLERFATLRIEAGRGLVRKVKRLSRAAYEEALPSLPPMQLPRPRGSTKTVAVESVLMPAAE